MSLDGACVSSSINATVIKDNALLIHNVRMPTDRRQYIYPEMKFSCNGSVIKWIYGAVDQNRVTGDLPELQIWRQTGPNSYNKQGSSLVTGNISIAPNVYEYYPVTPLEFQEGDNFGVHIPEDEDSKLLLYKQRESGPLNLYIDSVVDSPAPSTINEPLQTESQHDFPLVTLEISSSMPTIDKSYSTEITATTTTVITRSTKGVTATFITITGTLGMIYSLSKLYHCLYSLIDTSISPSPSIPVGTPATNTLVLLIIVSCVSILIIITLIIILVYVCLLFKRHKKTISLNHSLATTTVDSLTRIHLPHISNDDSESSTGLYADITLARDNIVIDTEENPAYGICDDDYI